MLEELQILKPLIINFLKLNNDSDSKILQEEKSKKIKSKLCVCNDDFYINDVNNSIQVIFDQVSFQKFISQQHKGFSHASISGN